RTGSPYGHWAIGRSFEIVNDEAVEYEEAERFVSWLLGQVVADARGDRINELVNAPRGRVCLGRVAAEEGVRSSPLRERGERLEACEIGVRVLPTQLDGRRVISRARFVVWREVEVKDGNKAKTIWRKIGPIEAAMDIKAPEAPGSTERGGQAE